MTDETNVRIFPNGKTDPIAMLEAAKEGQLKDVMIIGMDSHDELFVSGTYDDWAQMLMLLAKTKDFVMFNAQ